MVVPSFRFYFIVHHPPQPRNKNSRRAGTRRVEESFKLAKQKRNLNFFV